MRAYIEKELDYSQGEFIQKEALTYSGSAEEFAITLDRGTAWDIKEIDVYASFAPAAASYVQVLRKDSASTANERNSAHADSVNVLVGDQYLGNGTTVKLDRKNLQPYITKGLRLYLSLGASSGTVYVMIKYDYK